MNHMSYEIPPKPVPVKTTPATPIAAMQLLGPRQIGLAILNTKKDQESQIVLTFTKEEGETICRMIQTTLAMMAARATNTN